MAASPTRATFTIDVPGIGKFTFRRRTIRDDIAIAARWETLLGGITSPSVYLDSLASAVATYEALAVAYPEGWEPATVAEMDAVMDDRITELRTVYGALCAREDEFRPVEKRRLQAAGQSPEQDAGGVVPQEVSAAAD